MVVGVIGGYPEDFARLVAPQGIELRYIERDTSQRRFGDIDRLILVSRFVNHKHWEQAKSSGIPITVIRGGWSSVKAALAALAEELTQ